MGTLSVLRPIPESLRPQRSLRSSRALGVPPEATPCSPTPRQVKRAPHRRAPPCRARAEVPPAEGGPGSRGLSGLSAASRLAGGCPGRRGGPGIPGSERVSGLPRRQAGRACAPGSQFPKFGVDPPRDLGALGCRLADSATHLRVSATRDRACGDTGDLGSGAAPPLPHPRQPHGLQFSRLPSSFGEGCGSQRPGLQPVAESAGTLNYIDHRVCFSLGRQRTGPGRSWDLPSPSCSRELTEE